MADAVISVMEIGELVFKIKEAVEKARQNREDCLEIGRRVDTLRATLVKLQGTAAMEREPAMSRALLELEETLRRAYKLVAECQERNILWVFCTAGKLSKQLSEVNQRISWRCLDAMFVFLVCKIAPQGDGEHPPPAEPEMMEPHAVPGDPIAYDELPPPSPPHKWLHQIAEATVEIKAAVEKVRHNKEECAEIGKRVSAVSAFLLRFEGTEMMEELAMCTAPEKLLETFLHAGALVTDCQRRKLSSKELGEALDQMVLALDDMIDVFPPSAPERVRGPQWRGEPTSRPNNNSSDLIAIISDEELEEGEGLGKD